MGSQAKSRALAKEPSVGIEGSFPALWWLALALAFVALVLSLMPWTAAPDWLVQLENLTSDRTLDLSLELGYGPMGYADLATELNGAFSQGIVIWLLGGAEAIWVAALTFIVLAVGGSIFRRPFGEQQLQRLLVWGSVALAIAAGLTLAFAVVSGGILEESFAEVPSNLTGYLAYVGGPEVTGQGFAVTLWLWISLALAILALVSVFALTSGALGRSRR